MSLIDLTVRRNPLRPLPYIKKGAGAMLITVVWDTLKIEDNLGLLRWLSPLSLKPACTAKAFPYLTYFDRFINKDWERSHRSFSVPRRFSVRYPFAETLLSKWSSPPFIDPPVSMLKKATIYPSRASGYLEPLWTTVLRILQEGGVLFSPAV